MRMTNKFSPETLLKKWDSKGKTCKKAAFFELHYDENAKRSGGKKDDNDVPSA